MKSLFSIAYFPPITYFLYLGMGDAHLLEFHENYVKQSYRNRAHIYGANGPLSLTVPVIKKSNTKTLISDIRIGYDEDWQAQQWKSICSAYLSSPYFEFYKDDLEHFFTTKYDKLWDLNMAILKYFIELLDLHVEIEFTSEYIKNPVGFQDCRNSVHPKKKDELSDKLLDYWQVFADQHGFKPNLSILDLICNEGPNAENYIKKCLEKVR